MSENNQIKAAKDNPFNASKRNLLNQLIDLEIQHINRIHRLVGEMPFPVITDNVFGLGSIIRDIAGCKQSKEALMASEERFRLLAENASDIIFRVKLLPEFKYEYMSPAVIRITGYTPEEFYINPYLGCKIIHPEDRYLLAEVVKGAYDYNEPLVVRWVRKDGPAVWLEKRIVPTYDNEGNLVALEGVARDITERKKAEYALRISETRLRFITDNIIDMVSQTDSNFIYQYISPSHKTILGYEPEELLAKSIFCFMHPRDITVSKKNIDTKFPGRAEFRYKHANGHYIWLESTCNPLVEGGQIVGYIHVRRDITGRKEIEKKVKNYQGQLRSLATKLTLAEQKERHRIAAYLHDHIGQYLTIAKLKLDSLRESQEETDLIGGLTVIDKLIGKTIQGIRTLVYGISTPILYERGFEAGIKWLAEDLIEKHGIRLLFNSYKQPAQMSEEVSIILFTAVRELLINIVKHAEASLVSICIQKHYKEIQVLIYDDGKGFVISNKHNTTRRIKGFGLFSISERLMHLGGRLKIESKPGKGTRVFLKVPLKLK